MKTSVLILMAYAISASIHAQHTVKSLVNDETDLNSVKPQDIDPEGMEFERPFNFFVAAGAAGRFGDHYSVTISPIDNTVQFEEAFPIITRFSLGAVYNPVAKKKEDVRKEYIETKRADASFKQSRGTLAVALLANVFELGFTQSDINTTSLIDVGFGIGYRKDDFLVLATVEFTPTRTPREYFIDDFKDKDQTLILNNTMEPVQTISTDDDALFVNRIFASVGIKIAYAFTKKD